jgi:hypothetical protein
MKKKTRPKSVNSNGLFGPPPILAGEDETTFDELVGRVTRDIYEYEGVDFSEQTPDRRAVEITKRTQLRHQARRK